MPIAAFGDIFEPAHRWPSLKEISITGIVVDESWKEFINLHRRAGVFRDQNKASAQGVL